jgi:murein DD-endopeptidase MepM/ murein hydrolase activator NlpD
MLLFRSFIRNDSEGNGNFGSNRGARVHNGIDFAVVPGMEVLSPVYGHVTKIGYPYGDDLSYRYLEIESPDRMKHRLFYMAPYISIKVGTTILTGKAIGIAQDVSKRYSPKMMPHVHYEIKTPDGSFINPTEYFNRVNNLS